MRIMKIMKIMLMIMIMMMSAHRKVLHCILNIQIVLNYVQSQIRNDARNALICECQGVPKLGV